VEHPVGLIQKELLQGLLHTGRHEALRRAACALLQGQQQFALQVLAP